MSDDLTMVRAASAFRATLSPPGSKSLTNRALVLAALAKGTSELSNVLLGAGSTELIDLVIRCFVAPGEEVLLSVPTFSMYEARTRVVGGAAP